MYKSFFNKNWQILLLNIILILSFIAGYGRFGSVIIDSFREAYIPQQMLTGKLLYRDIFTIYPPFAYLFNAFLFLIFGTKLKVLYAAGFIAACGIINLTFKISSKFLPKTYALTITLFIIAAACLSPNVFNLFFPYSFGILYGILFILGAMLCSVNKHHKLAYFLYAMAICSKYEFIFVLPLFIWMSGKKNILKNLGLLLLPILFTSCILYFQGLRIADIITATQILLTMSSTKTLYWFYSVSGLVFRPEIIPIYFANLIKYIIPLSILYFFKNICTLIFALIYLYFFADPEILIYAFPLILILFIINIKHLNKKKIFIIFASLLVSVKVFFALTLQSYGVYFLPFALIPLFILIPKKIKKELLILFFFASIVIGFQNIYSLSKKQTEIKTSNGIVRTTNYEGEGLKALIEYIEKGSKKSDTVLVLPECLSVNILTGRKSDNKFYSLIPLYVETFGEDLIVERLKIKKPEYIIILNYDTFNYYYPYFGQNYGNRIYKYVKKDYELITPFKKPFINAIFKIKQ